MHTTEHQRERLAIAALVVLWMGHALVNHFRSPSGLSPLNLILLPVGLLLLGAIVLGYRWAWLLAVIGDGAVLLSALLLVLPGRHHLRLDDPLIAAAFAAIELALLLSPPMRRHSRSRSRTPLATAD